MYSPDIHIDTIGARLKKIRQERSLNQAEMAHILEITQGGYADIERGKNQLSTKIAQKIANSLNIDLNWLFTGVSHGIVQESEAGYNKQFLYPIQANAGIPFSYTQEHISGSTVVIIPGITGSLVVFMVDGLSMLPAIEPGSYLGCKRVNSRNDIVIDSIYIIVAKNGVWAKRIAKVDGVVTLVSDNSDYKEFSVDYDEIMELYRPIVKIIPFDSSSRNGSIMASYTQFIAIK